MKILECCNFTQYEQRHNILVKNKPEIQNFQNLDTDEDDDDDNGNDDYTSVRARGK